MNFPSSCVLEIFLRGMNRIELSPLPATSNCPCTYSTNSYSTVLHVRVHVVSVVAADRPSEAKSELDEYFCALYQNTCIHFCIRLMMTIASPDPPCCIFLYCLLSNITRFAVAHPLWPSAGFTNLPAA